MLFHHLKVFHSINGSKQREYILSDAIQIDESVLKSWCGGSKQGYQKSRNFFWRRNQGAKIKLF